MLASHWDGPIHDRQHITPTFVKAVSFTVVLKLGLKASYTHLLQLLCVAICLHHLQVNLKVFRHSSFRPAQRDIVVQAAQHRDLFVLMPTGGGKSLCYQVGPCLGFS